MAISILVSAHESFEEHVAILTAMLWTYSIKDGVVSLSTAQAQELLNRTIADCESLSGCKRCESVIVKYFEGGRLFQEDKWAVSDRVAGLTDRHQPPRGIELDGQKSMQLVEVRRINIPLISI